ncbi:hypothetical protein L6452_38867 [Arctium lappa]|uniref:Uncharacterized protein n=1 Tax=Arctium lappa TaxID=4217 RepID=A0ACB8XUU3_ARCLA|nr:hypothetical protein L6452_38867 [Arctium lappa]
MCYSFRPPRLQGLCSAPPQATLQTVMSPSTSQTRLLLVKASKLTIFDLTKQICEAIQGLRWPILSSIVVNIVVNMMHSLMRIVA